MIKKHANNTKIIAFVILAVVFVVAFASLFLEVSGNSVSYEIFEVPGWEMNDDDSASGSYTYSTYLGNYQYIPGLALSFHLKLCRVHVYIDDVLVYSFGDGMSENELYHSSAQHLIDLAGYKKGDLVTIEIEPINERLYSGFPDVYMGNHQDLVLYYIKEAKFQIYMGIFLLFFGGTIFMLLPLHNISSSEPSGLIYPSLISITMGLYLLSYGNFIYLITQDAWFNNAVCHISGYLIPVLITVFFRYEFNSFRKLFNILVIINIVVVAVSIVLALFDLVPHSIIQYVIHVLCVVDFPVISFTLVIALRKGKFERNLASALSGGAVLAGVVFFCLCATFHLIRIELVQTGAISNSCDYGIIAMDFGCLAFVSSMLVHYLFNSISVFDDDQERLALMRTAYYDALTGIANRAFCEVRLGEISGTGEFMRIIFMDLDNLKQINDSLGHAGGDRLLKGFATAMKEHFKDAKLIGRMGGDEFIVVLKEEPDEDFLKLMKGFDEKLVKMSQADEELDYMVSAGWAKSSEVESFDGREVLRISDERMYEEKQRHKAHGPVPGLGGAV